MYRALDFRSALSLGLRVPQTAAPRLASQSSSEAALTVLSLSFLLCAVLAVLNFLFSKNPEVDQPSDPVSVPLSVSLSAPAPAADSDALGVPHPRAPKGLAETRGSPADSISVDAPFAALPRASLLSSFGTMLASTLVARPIPVPVPVPVPSPVSVSGPVSISAPEPSTLADHTLDVAPKLEKPETPWPVKQPYDAFLVLDVEATCQEGTDFNWPNEIIEWPVCLLRWRHKDMEGRAKELYVADEFRSFVKPIWKPELSAFCTSLTGITQADVDRAPKFPKVLESFKDFLMRNGLIDGLTGEKLQRFTWCTDGPFDVRDFVVKQCFISKIQMPEWLKGDVLDVRKVVSYYLALQEADASGVRQQKIFFPKRRSLNISQQLRALSLPAFIGRQHSGIDDTRNIARIVTELAKRGIRLEPNTTIYPGRRWQWMGRPGQVLEEYCFI
ncbi:hypothetical protein M0805_009302 [Coniferiporia weirii]|nr:hypothetical protein M0805_009302 [Coniferiporia weirii]